MEIWDIIVGVLFFGGALVAAIVSLVKRCQKNRKEDAIGIIDPVRKYWR